MTTSERVQALVDNFKKSILRELEDLPVQFHKLETEKLQLTKDIEELKDSDKNSAEQEQMLKEANAEVKKLQMEKDRLQRDIQSLNKQVEEVKRQEAGKETTDFGARLGREKQLQEQLGKAKTHIRDIQHELEDTKLRLSKALGGRLNDGNPDIADLSDKNRPTKLAERFSELYDNQWTDAYDAFEKLGMTEEKAIRLLLQILQDVYDFCDKKAEKQMESIKQAMFIKDTRSAREIPKQYRDCRKEVGEESGKAVLEDYLEYLKHHRYTRDADKALQIQPYVKECIQLCWLMCLQDPPVVFDKPRTHGEDFNSDIYRAYTKNGQKIAFLVWPAMLLHKDGNVLCKGVAQCYDPRKQDYHKSKRDSKEAWPEAREKDRTEFYRTEQKPTYGQYTLRKYESTTYKARNTALTRPQSADRMTPSSRITDKDMNRFLYYREKYSNDLKMAKIMVGKDKYDRCYAHIFQEYH